MHDPALTDELFWMQEAFQQKDRAEKVEARLAAAENVVEAMRYLASAGESIPDWRSMAQYAADALAVYDAQKEIDVQDA